MWKADGIVLDLPKGKKHKCQYLINGVDFYYDKFPTVIVLNYPANNFKIYVNNHDYFLSKLPQLSTKSDYSAQWDLKNPYFQSIVATWIASCACGISMQHLLFEDDIPKQIRSFMRFHEEV